VFLDQILERNQAFVRGRAPSPLPPPERMRLAVVACYDPRLDPLLLPSLGLAPGEAFLLRTAGALVQPGSASLRSLGLAVFMFGVTEVLVVGHAACRMAAFDSAAFIDSFRGRGVPREAFGNDDLRTWAGAIPSPRQGVLLSASNIQTAQFLPRDVTVAGVVLDEATGALEVVLRPGEISPAALPARPSAAPAAESSPESPRPAPQGEGARPAPAPKAAGARPAAAQPARKPKPAAATGGRTAPPPGRPQPTAAVPQAARQAPPVPPAEGAPQAAAPDPLALAVDMLAESLRSRAHWRGDLDRLRKELDKPMNPLVKFNLLEAFARRAGAEAQEVRAAFQLVKEQAAEGRDHLGAPEVLEVLRHLARKL
jgi:carbonic anhydrase